MSAPSSILSHPRSLLVFVSDARCGPLRMHGRTMAGNHMPPFRIVWPALPNRVAWLMSARGALSQLDTALSRSLRLVLSRSRSHKHPSPWYSLTSGRHRWIDFSQHDFNASQVPPEWHSWLSHIRKDAPPNDPIMIASRPPWQTQAVENLTGTRARYTTYSTTAPKFRAWDPVVAKRGAVANPEPVKAPTA